jgi:hypothetical protein
MGIDREHVSLCYASVVFQLLVTLETVEINNKALLDFINALRENRPVSLITIIKELIEL